METVLYRHSEETPDECEVGHREGTRATWNSADSHLLPLTPCNKSNSSLDWHRHSARTWRVVRCAVVWRVSECHHSRTFSKLFNFSLFNFQTPKLLTFANFQLSTFSFQLSTFNFQSAEVSCAVSQCFVLLAPFTVLWMYRRMNETWNFIHFIQPSKKFHKVSIKSQKLPKCRSMRWCSNTVVVVIWRVRAIIVSWTWIAVDGLPNPDTNSSQ